MKSIKKSVLLILIIFTLTAELSSCARFYYSVAVKRNDKSTVVAPASDSNGSADEEEAGESIFSTDRNWFGDMPYVNIEIISGDGLKLAGYWLPYLSDDGKVTKNTVILVHGYSMDAFSMSSFARYYFNELGFNVLAVDARGHGASGGDYIGFGWHERFDIIDWADEVSKLTGDDCSIVLHGISMGGATVMMSSGEQLPDTVVCIVEDCGYTSVQDELTYQLEHFRNIDNPGLVERTSRYTKKKAGYSFEEASALIQVAKASVPLFFIHGGSDTFVPTEMVFRLYDACSSEKELFIVEGAEHARAWELANTEYRDRLKAFLITSGFII